MRRRLPSLLRSPSLVAVAAVLCAMSGCATTPTPTAPSSDLPRSQALSLAQMTAATVGGKVFAISATGSMKPTLDESSIVALEETPFTSLRQGDIVVYRSATGSAIIHRLYERQGNAWMVLGDNNPTVDAEAVTPANLIGRVCAIFYTSAPIPGRERAFASASEGEIPAQMPKNH
ncbi:signal peptidase I [Nibricoccus sp. IMCC34717]|uniref:signal peptidase I n=1 Tax=Nibricoccus sp. IMCC34717 TaxID=3034021 RepID=UPI00384E46C2